MSGNFRKKKHRTKKNTPRAQKKKVHKRAPSKHKKWGERRGDHSKNTNDKKLQKQKATTIRKDKFQVPHSPQVLA